MNNKFDELTKAMARSVTRRAALRNFGLGIASLTLACFGLTNSALAGKVKTLPCTTNAECGAGQVCCNGTCMAAVPDWCDVTVSPCCCYCAGKAKNQYGATGLTPCDPSYNTCSQTCQANAGFFGCGPAPV